MKLTGLTSNGCPTRWTKLSFVALLFVATAVCYFRNRDYIDVVSATRNYTTLKPFNIVLNKNIEDSVHLTTTTTPKPPKAETSRWNPESNERLEKILMECQKQEITKLRRVWTMASNKDHTGKAVSCNDKMCPMVVDESNLFLFCFIPRVASASIKEVFLKSQNLSTSRDYLEESEIPVPSDLDTAQRILFQKEANDILRRVSGMYFPEYIMRRYYKFLFVRHPFERLMSAFLTINELPLEERQLLFAKYWSSLLPKTSKPVVNLNDNNLDTGNEFYTRLTFRQFVHYLLNTHPVYYDSYWQPYWTRCNVCDKNFHYDFVGKLETAQQDFAYVLQAMELDQSLAEQLSVFLRNNSKRKETTLEKTVKFFKDNLEEREILKLYETYYFDFKLFDYDVRDFVSEKNLTIIDSRVKLDSILF